MMFTLYDLLDADPKADKERLKEAFRKAAKVSHPDVCPDDGDAPWRFRQIVRAHEILSDDELRAAYDHVVAFERRMQESAPPPLLNSILAKIVSGVVTAAVVAIALFGGYALSAYLAEAPVAVASTSQGQTTGRGQSDVTIGPVLAALREVTAEAAILPRPREIARELDRELARQTATEAASDPGREATAEAALADAAEREAAAVLEPVPERARRDAKFFRARGMLAYRFGDFERAIANFDAAIRLDPGFEQAYRDRAAAFSVTSRFERAAADLAKAGRIKGAHPTARHRDSSTRAAATQDALWRQTRQAHPTYPFLLAREADKVPWPTGG
jgi:curved DNA-binding protein CbpA